MRRKKTPETVVGTVPGGREERRSPLMPLGRRRASPGAKVVREPSRFTVDRWEVGKFDLGVQAEGQIPCPHLGSSEIPSTNLLMMPSFFPGSIHIGFGPRGGSGAESGEGCQLHPIELPQFMHL